MGLDFNFNKAPSSAYLASFERLDNRVRRFTFFTLEQYSFIALSNAIEPLRAANRIAGREVYAWDIATIDGSDAVASNGLKISPTMHIDEIEDANIVFVCGGQFIDQTTTSGVIEKLRHFAANRIVLGSLCTGGYCLAMAGLLDNYEAVVHWEQRSAMEENYPQIQFSDKLFSVDRNRFTCTGGTAPLHLMPKLISDDLGRILAAKVADHFAVDRIRVEEDKQYVPLAAHVGHYHPNLIEAASLMESNLEDPLPMEEIASLVGVSRRQIERLFKRFVGTVPTKYYLDLRLRRARSLLLETSMSVTQVAVACGFQSGAHFSKCYRDQYGMTPTSERCQRPLSTSRPATQSHAFAFT